MLADGSPISTDEYEEYDPVLLTRDDGYLVLLFASNRDCGGCTPNYNNLFVSVSTDPYYGDLELPTFNEPVVVLADGADPVNSINRLEFIAEAAGPNVMLMYRNGPGLSMFQLTTAGQTSGVGTGLTPIGNSTRTTDSLLGFGPESGSILTRDGSGVVRYSAITQPHNGRAVTNESYATAGNVSRINPLYTGFLGATFSADSGYLMMGTLYEDFGYHPDFQDAIDEEGISLTAVHVFEAGASAEDLLLFSAHDGLSEDLYVVTSHTVADLWGIVGIYGGYDDSAELRNLWLPVAATLPANRGAMAAATYGSKGYFFGGTADGSTTVNTIYEFDFATETFTNCGGSCGTWPTNLYGSTAIESGGLIYVVGGSTTTGAAGTINVLRSFNPSNQAVNALMTMPVSRQVTALALAAGKIYMLGGASVTTECVGGTAFGCSTNYSYTISGDSWSGALSPVTHAFSAGAAAVYGDSIFAFGGFVNSGSLETNAVGEYSVTGNTWPDCGSSCPTLTTGRYSLQAVTYGQYVYIIGGADQGGTSFNSVEEFDMVSKTFTDCDGGCSTMPLPRNVGSALLYGDQVYYFGGNNAGPYVNTIFKYLP